MNLPRLFRTVRHLRPVQIYGRIFAALPRPRFRAPLGVMRLAPGGVWQPGIAVEQRHLGGTRFRFLGEEHRIETAADWQRPALAKLWLYNLHYFDDLRALDSAGRRAGQRALLERWRRENPPGIGVGWEPYPCSLRIANWVRWALGGGELGPDLESSLALQAEHLAGSIEHHLQGNHLLANAKGLAFAGLFFAGDAAQRWLRRSVALLERQLPEQILADGGHCERSPMYHALVLEDLLDLINLSRASAAGAALDTPRLLEPRARAMLEWLRRMTHPDGEIAFFNDAARGIAAAPGELCAYASRLGLAAAASPLRALEPLASSGYMRARRGDATLFADVGEIGLEHLTGHAHADTLSFELSLGAQRVLVNSGTSLYGTGPERGRQRSTAAHNSVEIDGENSSEVWSGFRVGRRAHPFGLAMRENAAEISLRCSHDGYRHRPGHPVHERRWSLRERGLSVADRIDGGFASACAFFHFSPDVRAELDAQGSRGRIEVPSLAPVSFSVGGGAARLEPDMHHPEFGASLPSQVLRVEFRGPECRLDLTWS